MLRNCLREGTSDTNEDRLRETVAGQSLHGDEAGAGTLYKECRQTICKPVQETQMQTRQIVTCKPVQETCYKTCTYYTCKPVYEDKVVEKQVHRLPTRSRRPATRPAPTTPASRCMRTRLLRSKSPFASRSKRPATRPALTTPASRCMRTRSSTVRLSLASRSKRPASRLAPTTLASPFRKPS